MTDDRWTAPRRVAFVTCAAWPDLAPDDRLALPPLQARGVRVDAVRWDDQACDWTAYDLVVIRSTWDYTERHGEFVAWLGRMEAEQVPLWNPPGLARWNADKRYLEEIGRAGVPVVPTRWVKRGEATSLAGVLAAEGWSRAVVKPVVSGNARDTWTTSPAAAALDEPRFRELVDRGEAMVQPFLEPVASEGEWSLIFIGGELSHTVLKRPAAGDFRVQESYAGTTAAAEPDPAIVAGARAALAAVPWPWLYARVDGVRVDGVFHLMELEMLEPSLFLVTDERACERLADAVARALVAAAPR